MNDQCNKECPIECNKIKYGLDVKQFKFSTGDLNHLKTMFKLNETNPKINLTSINVTENDFVGLVIYFGSMSFIQYTESPAMTGFSLLSNIGGILGLFLGMSLISLSELLEIVVQSIVMFFNSKTNCRNKVKDVSVNVNTIELG